MPLLRVLDLLAAMSTVPITLDPAAMTQLGVTPRDPVSLSLKSTTVGKALQMAAAERGLAASVESGQVRITAPPEYRETFSKVRYTVSDLTDDKQENAVELAATVRKLVAPESWQPGGGRGEIEADPGALVVVQTGDVHHQVLVFCEKLRNARQKPLRSHQDPKLFTLGTRLDQARKVLDRPVTANFHEPARLAKVLAFFAEATDCDILIDRMALAAADTSDAVVVSFTVRKETLGQALAELLRPLGLAYLALGDSMIQVTTPEAAEEQLGLEFYPAQAWLAQGIPANALVERLRAEVAPATWSDAGGPGEVCFDPPSQYLLVLQSQPVHAAVERFRRKRGRFPLDFLAGVDENRGG